MSACAFQKRIDRMRQHREELALAIAQGLTLDQARERLASFRDHRPRLEAPIGEPAARPERLPHWWERD